MQFFLKILAKFLIACAAFSCLLASAQVCAPPSLLLTAIPPGGIVNDYYAGDASPTLNPNATTLVLGTRDTRGYTTTMVVGDLLMVMQMQDGTINSSNGSSYGNGSGSGNGSLTIDSAGLYEFVRVTNVAGSNITFTPGLVNQYKYTTGIPQKRYQVVRVLQFASVATTVAVTTPPWNSSTGGVVAMDVRDTLTLTGQTIEGQTGRAIFAAGKGFRGGQGRSLAGASSANADLEYAMPATTANGSSKGEGIIGTPVYLAIKTNNWGFLTTNTPTFSATVAGPEGYPGGGSYAKGAPGNAGGGASDGANGSTANSRNAGGGGGGNYGAGGVGGRPWERPLIDSGGRPGAGYAGQLAFNRVFLGGGGGAGATNNASADTAVYSTVAYPNQAMGCNPGAGICSSGAAGGGIVIIRARSVTGAGVIDVRGAHAYNVAADAAGGGGAGGTVVIETPNGGSATIDARGGDGGNAWAGNATWSAGRHGPGGAGGGGFIAYAPATMAISALYDGGLAGQTMSNSAAAGGPAIENYGSSSADGGLSTFQTPNVPGAPQAAKCDPALTLAKTDGITNLNSPGTNTYTLTIANNGASASAGTVTIADKLPIGLTVAVGPLALTGPHAAQWSCSASSTTDITCTSTASITGNGSTRSFSLAVTVAAANGTSVINKAQISGGGDPFKTTTATPVTADTCTGTDLPLPGCAVDTDTVVAPNLVLTKTDGVTQLARGTSNTYVLTVSNVGGSVTSSTITVADLLPTGLTYSGITPFTSGGFTCNVSGQGITCDSNTPLAVSSSVSITFTVSVGASPPSSVLNLAQVGGGGDPSPLKSARPTTATAALCAAPVSPATESSDANNGCAADIDEVRYINLDLSKDDGQVFISAGGFTDYVMTIRNIGTIATTGTLTLADVIPNGSTAGTITFSSAGTYTPTGVNGANWSCNASGTATFCTSNASIAAGGSSSFIIRVTASAASTAGTQFLNRARVGGGGDVSAGMVSAPDGTQTLACTGNAVPAGCAIDLDTLQVAPQVRMVKSHPNPQARSVGDTFTFTLVITNSGGAASAVNTVQMIDVIPAGLTISAITSPSSFTCGNVGQVVSCTNTVAQLTATTSVSILIGVTVTSAATNPIVNAAKVGTNATDPQNNALPTAATAGACTGTNVPTLGCAADPVPLVADLQILKRQRVGSSGAFVTTPVGVVVGGTVQYEITVSNAVGSAFVRTVTFADTIPNTFSTITVVSTVTSITPTATGCATALSGNLLNGTITSMVAGSTCTIVVQVVANANTPGVTNTAALSIPSGISDTVSTNNTSSVNTVVGYTDLTIQKTNGVGNLASGQTTSYTITIGNLGPTAAPNTVVTDAAVVGLSCTSVACTSSAVNMCPSASPPINSLQLGGITIGPAFAPGETITLVVTCAVTATGL
jgi:uncharacterized repeat protein (TIGR01451 family)